MMMGKLEYALGSVVCATFFRAKRQLNARMAIFFITILKITFLQGYGNDFGHAENFNRISAKGSEFPPEVLWLWPKPGFKRRRFDATDRDLSCK
jgi:hypothetical protein